jgi:hypothetical protein
MNFHGMVFLFMPHIPSPVQEYSSESPSFFLILTLSFHPWTRAMSSTRIPNPRINSTFIVFLTTTSRLTVLCLIPGIQFLAS